MKIRLLGDLHGDPVKINKLKQSLHFYDLTIQLGDFGIGFGAEQYLKNTDSEKLKILLGNHDHWEELEKFPHALDRYGILELNGKKIFYIGGAYSQDISERIPGLSWWYSEQLSLRELEDCLTLYENNCQEIDIMLSHDCPINCGQNILGYFPYENTTNKLLYEAWKIKEPKLWFFCHYHRQFVKKIGNTNFQCLSINEEFILEI